ncbi:MAG TPA: class I SAM-dependent methyltransferase [Ktedonobacteraceae bacterium]|nr:class I SAM-dependent methyltransferase [Ktedonobacteraceae bacterium]
MKQFDWETFYTFTKDSPPWPLLVRAVSLLTHKGRALDLGAGAGRDTLYLLQQGFRVTSVDSDPHAVAILSSFPQENLQVVEASFEDFAFETYDLINAQFALPFLSQRRFREVFERVTRAIRPGGIFVGQFFGIHDQWNTPEHDMTFLTRGQAEAVLQDMDIIEFNEVDMDGHVADGSPKHWHTFHIIARRKPILQWPYSGY